MMKIAWLAGLGLALACLGLALTGDRGRPTEAAFPGVNGKILFQSNRDGNPEIYVMNPDGSGQTNVTKNSAADQFANWSPNGRKIAFASNRTGSFEIYVMNHDGTGVTRLTFEGSLNFDPAWSPDGTKIVFESNRDHPAREIYVMNATDGTGVARLTLNTAFDGRANWSPDGTKIAFVSSRDGNNEIYVMNADGNEQTRLTNNAAAEDNHPNWSPDGTKIAFHSSRDFPLPISGSQLEIYVMNADGSEQTRLTNNSALDAAAAWSPDGTKIAFTSSRDFPPPFFPTQNEIYVMNADGSEPTRLTNNSVDDVVPDWQPCDFVPPNLTVSLSPNVLSPADRTMRTVNANISVSDECDPSPSVVLVSITASGPDIPNPLAGPLAGPDIQGAAFGTDDREFQLRAEIDADGTERVYTVTYRAMDTVGNSTIKSAVVTVPTTGP